VLREACEEAARWPDGISVAVNLSPVQLREVDLCQTVSAALARSGLSADRLELEITETMLLRNQVVTGMRRCGSFGRLAFELQWMISAPGIRR
jgi:EAL domain-containing protein (putative c-di-GMP-specific phosphodiesterase class I)